MSKQTLTPTPLVAMKERKPVAVVADVPGTRSRYLYFIGCLFQLVRAYASLWLRRQLTPANRGRQTRAFLERMGFLWIDLGRMMALRSDLYSSEFCRELDHLKQASIGFPFEAARKVVETELGQPLEKVFREFDPVPFRAGATFQVHRAVLLDSGDEVAVKVKRPETEAIFRKDSNLFRWSAGIFIWLGIEKHVRWDEVLWDLNQRLTTEIDYRYELSNLLRMRRVLRRQGIHVPKAYERLSGRDVLVMEFIRGALMSDVVELTKTDPVRLALWLQANQIKPASVGRRLFMSFLRQLIEENLVHGNLYPDNIVLLRGGRFAFVDLSRVITVETEFLRRYVQCLRAVANYQYGRAAELTLLLCPELPVVDVPNLKERLVRCLRAWDSRSELKRMPYPEKSLASVYEEFGKILFSCNITPSLTYMKIGHAWSTLDESLGLLIPDASYSKLFRRYFKNATMRSFRDTLRPGFVMEAIMGARDTIAEYQQIVGPMLRRGALVFQGGTTKLSDALAGVFQALRLASLLGVIFFVLKFMSASTPELFAQLPAADHLRNVIDVVWFPNTDVAILLAAATAYLFILFGRLCRRFRQPDVRLPNTSVLSSSN